MNYIELNGKSSLDVQGLLIQSLAPITKPKVRTEKTEIDGRDGDIITRLGYSAYDKEISIALSWNYDIDEVIQYFVDNDKGTVLFSNEEDKLYRYEILDQIDFERLIRFKTAKVKFHVQPFKFSAVESEKTFTSDYNNMLDISQFNKTVNGITLKTNRNVIEVSGACSRNTEIYLPISALNLNAGTYVLNAIASGQNANNCSIRLINSAPSDANSFGGTYVTLKNNDVATLGETLTQTKQYNYLWFFINAGATVSFTLTITLKANVTSFVVRNTGNYFSKPKLTINGSGVVGIYLNGSQVFNIDMSNTSQVLIDVEDMNAYYTNGLYANRIVTGNYSDFIFKCGNNTIGWTGNVTSITISDYSRWL